MVASCKGANELWNEEILGNERAKEGRELVDMQDNKTMST